VDGIRNNLFGPPGNGGTDLAALDIQRGRDHGLPDYNNLRGNYGLAPVTSFDQISSDPAIQEKLEQLFGNVDNIDAFTGILAEDHLPGTSAGPLLHAIMGNQFERLRDGDRFFYTTDPLLQSPEVQEILDINDVTLANVIRWNTNIVNIQDNVFFDRSVLFYKAPEGGSNVSVVTAGNLVSIIDNGNGRVVAARSLDSVSQVILVGSNTSADVFNTFIAGANGRLEGGVVAYGGQSSGDRLNVFGRALQRDTFTVTGQTVEAPRTAVNDPDVVVQRTVQKHNIDVNGNDISSSGFETRRLVKLGGRDTVNDADLLAVMVGLWNPLSND
jgi:hypothetical protein